MKFTELGLSETLLQTISALGFTEATEIQAGAIPHVLMGRDVLGIAQTGTGKTAAFTLPLVDILSTGRAKARMPRCLILEPTRELAEQVAAAFTQHNAAHQLKTAILIGGEHMAAQIKQIEAGADVLIATPGRLLDLFERGKLILSDVKILVIDEADRMLDMGFIPDIQNIVAKLSPLRQTLFFTATLHKEIRPLTQKFLRNPKEIIVTPSSSTASTIKQYIVTTKAGKSKNETATAQKRKLLIELLNHKKIQNAMIFCNQKRSISATLNAIKKAGFSAVALHGDLNQSERKEALEAFKSGAAQFVICSDVAARGIDVEALSHVINLDVPTKSEDYVHRIGRTGRAKKKGEAWTIATAEDVKLLQNIMNLDAKITLSHGRIKGHRNVPIGIDFSAETAVKETVKETEKAASNKAPRAKKAVKETVEKTKEEPKKTKAQKNQSKKASEEKQTKEVQKKQPDTKLEEAQEQVQEEVVETQEPVDQRRRTRKQNKSAETASERLPKKRQRRRNSDEIVQITAEEQPEPNVKAVEESLLKVKFKTITKPPMRRTAQGRTIGMGEHVPNFMLTEVTITSSAFVDDDKKA